MSNQRIYRMTWTTCRCGKKYASCFWGDPGQEEYLDLRVKLAEYGICRRCEQDIAIERDECPEKFYWDDGDGFPCGRPRNHTGRCEPMLSRAQLREAQRRARLVPPGTSVPVPSPEEADAS